MLLFNGCSAGMLERANQRTNERAELRARPSRSLRRRRRRAHARAPLTSGFAFVRRCYIRKLQGDTAANSAHTHTRSKFRCFEESQSSLCGECSTRKRFTFMLQHRGSGNSSSSTTETTSTNATAHKRLEQTSTKSKPKHDNQDDLQLTCRTNLMHARAQTLAAVPLVHNNNHHHLHSKQTIVLVTRALL